MNLKESISALGLEQVLLNIFPHLKGVNFKDVFYNEKFDDLGFVSPDEEDSWSFATGRMPFLYKECTSEILENRLEHLLLVNGISRKDSFQKGLSDEITFWQGNNFKIEKVDAQEGPKLLIITPDVTKEKVDSGIFKASTLAKEVISPEWIQGIKPIHEETSITGGNKSLQNFDLCPLLFKEGDEEYILIPLNVFDFAEPIIQYIIGKNGGTEEFVHENADGWEHAFRGKIFAIGFLSDISCIRINRIQPDIVYVENENLKFGIHLENERINQVVQGLNKIIYAEGEGNQPDGRLIGLGDNASTVVGFASDPQDFITTFKRIVLRFNPEDEFLKLSSSSITKWLDENPEETITFEVDNSFTLILSKGNSLYRLNILPSNLSLGWNADFELNPESEPKVVFSKSIELAAIPISEIKANAISASAESKDNLTKEKQTFIQNSLDDKLMDSSKSRKNSYLRWIWGLLAVLMLLLLLRNCEFNPDSKYYYERGLNKYDSGEIEKAEKDFGRAINLDNSYSDAYQARGELYLENERYQEALYDFDQLIRIDDKDWYAYYLRGLTHMKLANSQYSNYNSKAINDFTQSIELNSTSINGRSYYQRASVFKSIGDERSCEDFYRACDFEIFDACEIVDNECRLNSGSLPYENIFGPGVYTGNGEYSYTNNCDKDAVVTLKSLRTKRAVRSVFIRSGDKYVIDKIPRGSYRVSILYGEEWLDKTNNRGRFNVGERAEVIDGIITYTSRGEKKGLQDCVIGGSISGSDISIDEYFNR